MLDPTLRTECPICGSPSTLDCDLPDVKIFRCSHCTHRFSQLRPERPLERYDRAYFEETHRNWFNNPDLRYYEKIARLIDREPAPRFVIDVGCGRGSLLRFLKDRIPSAVLTGTDLATPALNSDFEFIQGDILKIDLGRQFSVVVTLAVIEHILDVRAFVQRLEAIAAPGALVLVMTLNDDSTLYVAARMARMVGFKMPFNRLYSHHHLHHFNRASLAKLLASEGFEIEDVILHNVPLAAVDTPAPSRGANLILRASVAVLFSLGTFSRRTYLQTIASRKPL